MTSDPSPKQTINHPGVSKETINPAGKSLTPQKHIANGQQNLDPSTIAPPSVQELTHGPQGTVDNYNIST